MIILSILFLIAFAVFVVLNLGAAGAAVVGFIILITLWLRRRSEFWPLLLAMSLLFGGLGATSGSWGAYYFVSSQTPDWGYAVLAWLIAYAIGGIGGALLGVFGVALRRRGELPLLENQLKTRFQAVKTQFSTLGFRQTLRVGAYSLRFAFGKRIGAEK